MDRFPMLTTYKSLLNGVAILTLVAGLFIAIDAAKAPIDFRGETEFEFGVFLLTIIPFGIGAFMLAVSAELINLFLTIEDRLYEIQYNTSPKRSAPQPASPPAATQTNATAGTSEETVYPAASPAAAYKIRATVTAANRTVIYQRPNKSAPPYRIAVFGEDVTLVGRTEDCAWMKIDGSYDGWIDSADLTLHDDGYELPVVSG